MTQHQPPVRKSTPRWWYEERPHAAPPQTAVMTPSQPATADQADTMIQLLERIEASLDSIDRHLRRTAPR